MIKKITLCVFIVNIFVLDIILAYPYVKPFLIAESITNENKKTVVSPPPDLSEVEYCDATCKELLFSEIEKLKNLGLTSESSPTVTPATFKTIVPTKSKVKSVSYLPIPGSGNTLATSWTDIAGTDFYMSKADYPGLTGVYFEANMKLLNGNGSAALRIFDVTHGIAVNGSEISTSSQTSTFVGSGAISLWEGFNHYVVQAKSLTSDTTVFESGKLKIVSEN